MRHFLKGFGDWDTNSFKTGSVEPGMQQKWSTYGGSRPEQPMQNIIALGSFLIMLARGDATFDGSHFCLPGPIDY